MARLATGDILHEHVARSAIAGTAVGMWEALCTCSSPRPDAAYFFATPGADACATFLAMPAEILSGIDGAETLLAELGCAWESLRGAVPWGLGEGV